MDNGLGAMPVESARGAGLLARSRAAFAAMLVACALVCGSFAALLSGCDFTGGGASTPEQAVERFVDAADDMNISGMLDYCTDSSKVAIQALLSGLGQGFADIGIPGLDSSTLTVETISKFAPLIKSAYSYEISLVDVSVTYADDTHATATCVLDLTEYGSTHRDSLEAPLVYENGGWKLAVLEDMLGELYGM